MCLSDAILYLTLPHTESCCSRGCYHNSCGLPFPIARMFMHGATAPDGFIHISSIVTSIALGLHNTNISLPGRECYASQPVLLPLDKPYGNQLHSLLCVSSICIATPLNGCTFYGSRYKFFLAPKVACQKSLENYNATGLAIGVNNIPDRY
jgi:hypothetical protein